jgi:hypothetical protein
MRHHLAVVACVALTGSLAHAQPERDDDWIFEVDPSDDDDRDRDRDRGRGRDDDDRDLEDDDDIAFLDDDRDDRDDRDEDLHDDQDAVEPRRHARVNAWHVAVGPYLWASSVDANISLGPASVSTGVDFFEIQRHAQYGAEILVEARYRRFSFYGDVMYGVVSVDGSKEVGPLMVTLDGTASSLLIDGTAGYLVAGGEHALLSLEARAGVRYQRTAVAGSVNIAGADVAEPSYVDAAADALVGAHAVVRPFDRFFLSGTVDVGLVGDSTTTWSASADASVRITQRVLLSLGWRTLTTERPNVAIVMHGPRAALQLTF